VGDASFINMYKILLTILCIFLLQSAVLSDDIPKAISTGQNAPEFYTAAQQARDVFVFCENGLFGLKDKQDNIIAPAKYQKIVMTGRHGWIIQIRNKYGLMDSEGKYLIEPKYRFADRIMGRYIKLGNENNFGIYNEFGEAILPPVYTSIDLLYGQMFLTYKNYRYGISDFKGNILIPNICDDIYMPTKETIRIKYLGKTYEIDSSNIDNIAMPDIKMKNDDDENSPFKEFVVDTGTMSGYSVLTFSDYLVKVFSSISPAHEETIDDLILSHGVDTVGILKKFSWLPKYPVTFCKKYYAHLRNPFNGPLADTRSRLKNKR
jgi:hypothetical protein